MRAGAVGQVVETRHPDFQRGDCVQGLFGWQEYVVAGAGLGAATRIPDGTPLTWPLGVLGITGLTAYFGVLDVAQPRSGECVVVSGAAGATGSIAGQIAKLEGGRVIGIAGGSEKCGWLTAEAGFDAAIDYKSENVASRLRELCPDGIDVYFDNVGGEILETVLDQIALRARVALCGAISIYNDEKPRPGPRNLMNLVIQRGRMEGFLVIDYAGRFGEGRKALAGWVESGEIQHKEDVQEGFENTPRTLLRLFQGKNFGKQILKLVDPPLERTGGAG